MCKEKSNGFFRSFFLFIWKENRRRFADCQFYKNQLDQNSSNLILLVFSFCVDSRIAMRSFSSLYAIRCLFLWLFFLSLAATKSEIFSLKLKSLFNFHSLRSFFRFTFSLKFFSIKTPWHWKVNGMKEERDKERRNVNVFFHNTLNVSFYLCIFILSTAFHPLTQHMRIEQVLWAIIVSHSM